MAERPGGCCADSRAGSLPPRRHCGGRARTDQYASSLNGRALWIALLPAGFLVAGLTLRLVSLFPLRNRLGLVVVHLLVHARAVLLDDVGGRARLPLVVGNALVDPLDVVGGRRLREGDGAREHGPGDEQRRNSKLHGSSLPNAVIPIRRMRTNRQCGTLPRVKTHRTPLPTVG